jgi:uncharacterized membrane protein YedE/YeeE
VTAAAVTSSGGCRLASTALAAVAGALFGAGLLLSGMTQPAKVVAFLRVGPGWDPSLAFVMGGAVAVYALTFAWIRRGRAAPWFDGMFHLPTRRDIDAPLVIGAAVFGLGWGLGGYCPGSGLVSAAGGSTSALVFVAAMLAGMLGQHRVATRR